MFSTKELIEFLEKLVQRFKYVVEPSGDLNLDVLRIATVPENTNIDTILGYELRQVRRSIASGFHNIALQLFIQ